MKFGGTSVGTIEKIINAAEIVKRRHKEGNEVILSKKRRSALFTYSPSLSFGEVALLVPSLQEDIGDSPFEYSFSIAVALSWRCKTPSKQSGKGILVKYITVKSCLLKRLNSRARSSTGIASKY